jgi:hypothetical protein
MSTNGQAIHFKKDTFAGQTGWINTTKGTQGFTPEMVHVIIGTGPSKDTHTMVLQNSIAKQHEPPESGSLPGAPLGGEADASTSCKYCMP